jgi:hypothetical protein
MNKLLFIFIFIFSNTASAFSFSDKNLGTFDFSGHTGYRYGFSGVGHLVKQQEFTANVNMNWRYNQYFSASTNLTSKTFGDFGHLSHGFVSFGSSLNFIDPRLSAKLNVGVVPYDFNMYSLDVRNPRFRTADPYSPHSSILVNLEERGSNGLGFVASLTWDDQFTVSYTYTKPQAPDFRTELFLSIRTLFPGAPLPDIDSIELSKQSWGDSQILKFDWDVNENWNIQGSWRRFDVHEIGTAVEYYVQKTFGHAPKNSEFQGLYLGAKYESDAGWDVGVEAAVLRFAGFEWDKYDRLGLGLTFLGNYDINQYFSVRASAAYGSTGLNDYDDSFVKSIGRTKASSEFFDFGVGATGYYKNIEVKADIHYSTGTLFLNPTAWYDTGVKGGFFHGGTSITFYWE